MSTRISIFDSEEDLEFISQRRSEINISENKGCQSCGRTEEVVRYCQRTMYPYEGTPGDPDDPNMVTLCIACKEDNDAYWDERWEEYYQGCL